MTPTLDFSVLPREKSNCFPYKSLTFPPASSTRRDPDAWSYNGKLSALLKRSSTFYITVSTPNFFFMSKKAYPNLFFITFLYWKSQIYVCITSGNGTIFTLTVHSHWWLGNSQQRRYFSSIIVIRVCCFRRFTK